jgi:hypothetical protein
MWPGRPLLLKMMWKFLTSWTHEFLLT